MTLNLIDLHDLGTFVLVLTCVLLGFVCCMDVTMRRVMTLMPLIGSKYYIKRLTVQLSFTTDHNSKLNPRPLIHSRQPGKQAQDN